jgi:glutathione-independent formaldehyde dehydrogenase
MVRGGTTAPKGTVLEHEISGEVMEAGPDVEFIMKGQELDIEIPFRRTTRAMHFCGTG